MSKQVCLYYDFDICYINKGSKISKMPWQIKNKTEIFFKNISKDFLCLQSVNKCGLNKPIQ